MLLMGEMISFIKKVIKVVQSYNKVSDNVIDKTTTIGSKVIMSKTKWGKYSVCGFGSEIVDADIGNFVTIGDRVIIGPRSHIYKNFTTHDFIYTSSEFNLYRNLMRPFDGYQNKIGHDVYIGSGSVVLPTVEIGIGAIVEPGSVLTKSVPPYAIVGGNPAKFLKWRFEKSQIQLLSESKWYLMDLQEICNNKSKFEKMVNYNAEEYKIRYYQRRVDIVTTENM